MSEIGEAQEASGAPVLTTPEAWRGYLQQYDERYLRTQDSDEDFEWMDEEAYEEFLEGAPLGRWLGEAPATEAALAAAEGRLGVRFPPSLRGFLLASNGWKRVNGWVDLVHPCERVTWMREGDAGSRVIAIYDSIEGNEEYVELFNRSIEVAVGEDFWLLDPTDAGPDGEWKAYLFTPKYGDVEEFPNFAELFDDGYTDME
ncbi:SMI1/KNR4 family protein [Streptomyces sp. NPDC049916]|uniref:SMI1/KNR4 family protein n=1 Tax=Streptomyces sp. NPDC049916 TaxID=3155156 RepID=UPI003416CAE5